MASCFWQARLPSISLRKAPPPRGNRLSFDAALVGWQATSTVGAPLTVVSLRNSRACFPAWVLLFSSSPSK